MSKTIASDLFLNTQELATLTGINTGRNGKTREQRQAEWLRSNGLLFRVNARGTPLVTRASIEGRKPDQLPASGWVSNALRAAL